MPIFYGEKKITPGGLVISERLDKSEKETQEQYLNRIKAMKMKSAGTGIKTMLPPSIAKPEVEELEQRS